MSPGPARTTDDLPQPEAPTTANGLPQEKLVALRQCIEKIFIDKPAGIIKLRIRLACGKPAGYPSPNNSDCLDLPTLDFDQKTLVF
jgi:hypothetical protein